METKSLYKRGVLTEDELVNKQRVSFEDKSLLNEGVLTWKMNHY